VGLVVVFFMLLWEMKRARDALLGLLPVILSVLWTVAGMALLGLALNFLNVFVITMIIGIGVDYGIHMIHRVREGGGVEKVAETARAVVFASLTTVVGFGSLVTSHFPGLRSIGAMTSAGVVLACLVAVALLPLLVQEKAGSKGP
jgi:Predicted exporters of the RND superfamily